MGYQILHGLAPAYLIELEARFWAKVNKSDRLGCWLWTAGTSSNGYGHFKITYKNRGQKGHQAHRVAYELVNGPIPRGCDVCHTCDTPLCINPAHLFAGSRAKNMQDMMRKGRSGIHFKKGMTNPRSKLTRSDVKEIRAKYRPQVYGCKILAEEYGVHLDTIHKIVTRKTWKHL